jgi:hypothetical protein
MTIRVMEPRRHKDHEDRPEGEEQSSRTALLRRQQADSFPSRFVYFVFFVFFVSSWFNPSGARAADSPEKSKPEWRTTMPVAIARGKTATIRILGQDLAPKEIKFEDSRITARVLKTERLSPKSDAEKAKGNSAVDAEVTSPADLPPAVYPFNLIQDGAGPTTGKVYIDQSLPEIASVEPNESLRKPQVLPPGSVAVEGKLDKDGVDVFQISGRAGETWRIEVLAHRFGSPFEPVLRLRDPHLTSVRVAVDQGEDCAIEYRLPMDGPYLIELFDGNNEAKPEFVYRLRVVRETAEIAQH